MVLASASVCVFDPMTTWPMVPVFYLTGLTLALSGQTREDSWLRQTAVAGMVPLAVFVFMTVSRLMISWLFGTGGYTPVDGFKYFVNTWTSLAPERTSPLQALSETAGIYLGLSFSILALLLYAAAFAAFLLLGQTVCLRRVGNGARDRGNPFRLVRRDACSCENARRSVDRTIHTSDAVRLEHGVVPIGDGVLPASEHEQG